MSACPAPTMRPLVLLWSCLVLPGEMYAGGVVEGCGARVQPRLLGLQREELLNLQFLSPPRLWLIIPGLPPPHLSSASSALRGGWHLLVLKLRARSSPRPGVPASSWLSGCERSFSSLAFIFLLCAKPKGRQDTPYTVATLNSAYIS